MFEDSCRFCSKITVSLQRWDSNDPTDSASPPSTGTRGDGWQVKEIPSRRRDTGATRLLVDLALQPLAFGLQPCRPAAAQGRSRGACVWRACALDGGSLGEGGRA